MNSTIVVFSRQVLMRRPAPTKLKQFVGGNTKIAPVYCVANKYKVCIEEYCRGATKTFTNYCSETLVFNYLEKNGT